MKSRRNIAVLVAVVLGLCGVQAARAQVVTGQVYEISLSGSASEVVTNSSSQDVVAKLTFTSAQLINLARGRDAGSVVPANEKLAVVIVFVESGDPSGSLIVYDTQSQSNLVTLADLDLGGAIDSIKHKGVVGMAGSLNNAGSFSGGWVAFAGKATFSGVDPSAPDLAFSGTLLGLFRGNDGEDFEVICPKGKASVKTKLGILLIPVS